ncbi:polysaccharide deacetylase family protein [Flavicella sp.]|uniref:polysaccharide deacetylase family protein n=1 Tax=Flavicella sp. TaxID=2957742 RepID=UPI0030176E75
MVLVYTHKISPRLTYIFKHIFIRILNTPVQFTTKIEEFVAFSGMKMNYSKTPLGNEFFIRSVDLLFEQGINDIEFSISNWEEGLPCFFTAGKKSFIPYDIFAASFYLMCRYEEYLPHVQDEHERFSVEDSLAFQNGFLDKPLVDIWAYKFLDALKEKFPEQEFVQRKFSYISTFDVNQAYIYGLKGVVRSVGGFISDFFSIEISDFIDRILVLVKIKKDPYDTFDEIVRLKKSYEFPTILFFLISNFSTYDNNVSISRRKYRLLIKSMSDYVKIGSNLSYFTMKKEDLMKKELKKMESIINTPVSKSKQHMLRIHLPETYQKLIDLEVEEDYSMGYSDYLGFRASTCTPFYFYDLDFEIQTPLKVFPFAVNDYTLNQVLRLSPRQALVKIKQLYLEVKNVNGTFVTLFHNELLSDYGVWKGWKGVYGDVLDMVKNN